MKNNTKKGDSAVKEFLTIAADWNKERKAKDDRASLLETGRTAHWRKRDNNS